MQLRTGVRMGALATVTALVATGCLSEGGEDGGGGGGGGGDGSVEIVGAPTGANAEGLQAEMERLSEELGIEVTYDTLPDFDTVIQSRVRGNNAPDIALFPQPGVLCDLADGGDVMALEDLVDVEGISQELIPGVGEVGICEDGSTYGIPISINVKSLVWTPKGHGSLRAESRGQEGPEAVGIPRRGLDHGQVETAHERSAPPDRLARGGPDRVRHEVVAKNGHSGARYGADGGAIVLDLLVAPRKA